MVKDNYLDKRQSSSKKRFVATFPDGSEVQASTQQEFAKLQKEHLAVINRVTKVEKEKPKFDPDSGERIN